MIDASLNEVEGLAARAARGAGLPWGLAEETGKAARWLASCGLDWSSTLVGLLADHPHLAALASGAQTVLSPAEYGKPLSPIVAGAHIDDIALLAGDLAIAATAWPLWLLPFAARAANETTAAVILGWADVAVTIWPYGGDVSGNAGALLTPLAEGVTWSHVAPGATAPATGTALTRVARSAVADDDWQRLVALGARTFVPASAHSRMAGAGAGLIDND